MKIHQHTDACETCGEPVFDNCHYCGNDCCSEHAIKLPGYSMLRACPDCFGERSTENGQLAVAEVA